jgi:Fe-S oxidoreductase
MDRKKGERFSDIRIQQAVNAGAEVLATACPYCIVNFEDSRLTLPGGEAIEIRDITEIVQEAL